MTAASALIIAVLTLRPVPGAQLRPFTFCLVCSDVGTSDLILNVLLFVPLGIGLALLLISRRRAMLVVCLSTISIEMLQATVVVGRYPSSSDLVANGLGGGLGILLVSSWRFWLRPSPRTALQLAAIFTVAWLLQQVVVSLALQRLTGAPEYYGQWAHRWPDMDPYPGVVRAFAVNDQPVPDERITAPGTVAPLRLGDSVEVQVDLVPNGPTVRSAPIVSISNETLGNIFFLGQLGHDLIFRMRLRASALHLRTPSFRIPAVFRDQRCEEDVSACGRRAPVNLVVIVTSSRIRISIQDGRSRIERQISITPALAWSLVVPIETPAAPLGALAGALSVALLLAPVGYWLGRVASFGRAALGTASGFLAPVGVAGIATALGLYVIPTALGVAASPLLAAAASVLALLLGLLIGTASIRRSAIAERSGWA